jgi:hypothetical protein
MIGHRAPEVTRSEMARWLKSKYPQVKILALNPLGQIVPGADHNALLNEPELWLPLLPAIITGPNTSGLGLVQDQRSQR